MNEHAPTQRRSAILITSADVPIAHAHAHRAPLGPLEKQIVSALDGVRTIGEIAREQSLSIVEVSTICLRLRELELLSIAPFGSDHETFETALVDGEWDLPAETIRQRRLSLLPRRSVPPQS